MEVLVGLGLRVAMLNYRHSPPRPFPTPVHAMVYKSLMSNLALTFQSLRLTSIAVIIRKCLASAVVLGKMATIFQGPV